MDRGDTIKLIYGMYGYICNLATSVLFVSLCNRPFSYSAKEPGSSVIFIHFIHEIRSSGVRASITIVYIRKFYKMLQSIVRLRFFFRIAKRSIQESNFKIMLSF